jgi:hypothetical protein
VIYRHYLKVKMERNTQLFDDGNPLGDMLKEVGAYPVVTDTMKFTAHLDSTRELTASELDKSIAIVIKGFEDAGYTAVECSYTKVDLMEDSNDNQSE